MIPEGTRGDIELLVRALVAAWNGRRPAEEHLRMPQPAVMRLEEDDRGEGWAFVVVERADPESRFPYHYALSYLEDEAAQQQHEHVNVLLVPVLPPAE